MIAWFLERRLDEIIMIPYDKCNEVLVYLRLERKCATINRENVTVLETNFHSYSTAWIACRLLGQRISSHIDHHPGDMPPPHVLDTMPLDFYHRTVHYSFRDKTPSHTLPSP